MKSNIVVALAITLAIGSGIFVYTSAHDIKSSASKSSKSLKGKTKHAELSKRPVSQVGSADAGTAKPTNDTTENKSSVSKDAESAIKITAKPLSAEVNRGLAYLVSQQDKSGGWAQGDEARTIGGGNTKINEQPNVADTCLAALALVRAGNYPDGGKYADNVNKAVEFVCDSIEKADADSIYVTSVRNTRVQMKLGPYVDTFFASLLLAEIKDHMPTDAGHARVRIALQKVVHKIQSNQQSDGQWAGGGWAPIHSQALAIKGLNRAAQVGAVVSPTALANAEGYARRNFDKSAKQFNSAGSAGIGLYSAGATLGALQSSVETNEKVKTKLTAQLNDQTLPDETRFNARRELTRIQETEADQKQAVDAVTLQLKDDRFVSGFGCNGGEEFLSYLHISETLLASKKSEFPSWDSKITKNLNRVQNQDGSWMGQHCITSRTFCTGAALLVLMADRATSPAIASK